MSLDPQKMMDMLENPAAVSEEALEALKETLQQHPYFQAGHTLFALIQHQQQTPDARQALARAAIYAPSRRRLKQLFDALPSAGAVQSAGDAAIQAPETIEEQPEEAAAVPAATEEVLPEVMPAETTPTEPEAADSSIEEQQEAPEVTNSKDVYQELQENLQQFRTRRKQKPQQENPDEAADEAPARATQPQEETSEPLPFLLDQLQTKPPQAPHMPDVQQKDQMELIDKFIDSDAKSNVRIRWRYQEGEPEDLSEKNLFSPTTLVTENMADIYVRQGKKDKAIEIYQQLILKYPDKKTYFAEKIDSLKAN